MTENESKLATELTKLQLLARDLLNDVEGLEGQKILYTSAVALAKSADAVRVALGDASKLNTRA